MDQGTVAYKCPSCGAGLTFSITSGDFHCEYCGSHFRREQLDGPLSDQTQEKTPYQELEKERDEAELEEQRRKFGDENSLYMCPSCGAAIITDSSVMASTECYYCHSPVVLSGRLSGEFRPDKIIPFRKTKEEAIKGFEDWTKNRRFFLAKGFGSKESLSKIQGIYIPFWLADCCVEGFLTADCYKTISTVRKGDYIVHTEEKSLATRNGSIIFHGVPADGSSRADDALMDSIEPFDYRELVEFDMSYLSGHNAQRYDVDKEAVLPRIDARVKEAAEDEFKNTIVGYSRIDIKSKAFNINNINWKNVMLPMWFLTFFYKDKLYYYAMNGQTGKFGGLLPFNKLKLVLFSLGIPLAAAALLSLLLMILGGA